MACRQLCHVLSERILFLTEAGSWRAAKQNAWGRVEGWPYISVPVFSKERINCFPPEKVRQTSSHTSTAPQVNKSSAGIKLLLKKKQNVPQILFLFLVWKNLQVQPTIWREFYKPKRSSRAQQLRSTSVISHGEEIAGVKVKRWPWASHVCFLSLVFPSMWNWVTPALLQKKKVTMESVRRSNSGQHYSDGGQPGCTSDSRLACSRTIGYVHWGVTSGSATPEDLQSPRRSQVGTKRAQWSFQFNHSMSPPGSSTVHVRNIYGKGFLTAEPPSVRGNLIYNLNT